MISFINSWAQNIIIALVISTIIEMILPEGNNKKYVKVILGMYILFTIVFPFVNKFSRKSINLESIITNTNKQMDKYQTNYIAIETNSYIEETYKDHLKENIIKCLNEKGYKVSSLNVYIESKDENRYAQINSLVMNISKDKNVNKESVNLIEEISINISNTSNSNLDNNEITKDEIESLKEYLMISYSIEKERIHINE